MPAHPAFFPALVIAALLLPGAALAQAPKPPAMPAAEATARRFPQPVRVGDLLGRAVLQPLESQPLLGRVGAVVRRPDGTIDVVLERGGILALTRRRIAVPVDAMALLGQDMVLDLTPGQLDALPTFDGTGTEEVGPDTTIKVALARPSH